MRRNLLFCYVFCFVYDMYCLKMINFAAPKTMYMKRYLFLSLWLIAVSVFVAFGADKYTARRLERMNLLPSSNVNAVLEDSEGYMWYGTDKGLCRDNGYQIDVFRHFVVPFGNQEGNNVLFLAEDSTHNILVGTGLRLNCLNKADYTTVDEETFPEGRISALCVGSNGHIWVAVGDRIIELNSDYDVVRTYASRHNGRPCDVTFLYEDSNNRIWALQDGGIIIKDADQKAFVEYLFVEGAVPVSVIEDRRHFCFWIATRGKGIVRYVPSDNPSKPWCTLQFETFSLSEPLRSCCNCIQTDNASENIVVAADDNIYQYHIVEHAANSSLDYPMLVSPIKILYEGKSYSRFLYRDRRGSLWTVNKQTGIIRLVEDENVSNKQENALRRVRVTTAVMDTTVHYIGLGEQELRVPAGCDLLELRFSTLDLLSRGEVRYQYSIPELDNSWTTLPPGENKAYVVNLPKGKYSVMVRTAHRDGKWSKSCGVLIINRLPAWWETWWMVAVYVLVALSIIVALLCLLRRRKAHGKTTAENQALQYVSEDIETQNDEDNGPSVEKEKRNVNFTPSEHDKKLLEDAERCVQRNIDNEAYSVNDLSNDLCMSRMNMYRKITVLSGMKPTEFIRAIRLRRAAQMLEDPKNNVSDVAYACGFSSPNYFSRCFKEMYGMTPTEYAEQ